MTNREDVARQVRALRNYGERERYHHTLEGFNSRLDELQAAILRAKLPHLDGWNAKRRERAVWYRAELGGLDLALPPEADWGRHCYHLFVVRTPARDRLRNHLTTREIGTQLHYPVPVHLQEAYAFLGKPAGSFPHAERACSEVLSLPLYPELEHEEVLRIVAGVRGFFL